MKVYLLHDGIYERVLSVHASKRAAKKAMKDHLENEVTESAKDWWARFGVGGKHGDLQGRFRSETLEEHIEKEKACVQDAFWIEEQELS